jgi:predicted Zn-dependent protease
MKFTPKELPGNVNVSRTHPLAELGWLSGGLIILVAIVYLAFWLATEYVVPRIPVTAENWIAEHLLRNLDHESDPALQKRLDALLEVLPADSPLHRYNFSISVANNEEINALALPGGHIVVFSGLLQAVRSENELAMVLGHELGHYAHRDHLRGLGRGLGATVVLAALFGRDSRAAKMSLNLFLGLEMQYSQRQEASADAFGLHLLAMRYGHVGGAVDFFTRLADKGGGRFSYLLASHPRPQARIAALRRLIDEAGYREAATVPVRQADLWSESDPQIPSP